MAGVMKGACVCACVCETLLRFLSIDICIYIYIPKDVYIHIFLLQRVK